MNRFVPIAFVVVLSLGTVSGRAAEENDRTGVKKIVLIAGLPDGHAPTTHEFAKGITLLKNCLDNSPNVKGIKMVACLEGWPKDPSVMKNAATIVIYGGAWKKQLMLQGDNLEHLGRLMNGGVGLVCIHASLYMPNKRGGPELLKWIGGYHDYQANYSTHVVTTKDPRPATPASSTHPINRGWKEFTIPNEFYIRQRFRENDKRLVPILTTMLPKKKPERQVIAWAVERDDGGRGFGFTGGHFHKNWQQDDYRKLVLNAILWTAKVRVPVEGVQSTVSAEYEK